MSWLDWRMVARSLPMPPASPPLATIEGGEDERVEGGTRRAVIASQMAELGHRPRRTEAMWTSLDGGERLFCCGGQLEWGEGDDAWGRLGGMGEGGCIFWHFP